MRGSGLPQGAIQTVATVYGLLLDRLPDRAH
jgi:hypothetical protein